jgi:type IV pilus assembly protein PilA
MLKAIRERLARGREEGGFTLIELMVVVLIIAILIAIAIPTFLGARQRAQNRAAQSDLRNGLVAAKTLYTDDESFVMTAAELEAVEPNLDFDDAVANSTQTVIGVVDAADDVVFVKRSGSGTYYCIAESESAGTSYDSGAAIIDIDTLAECNGTAW